MNAIGRSAVFLLLALAAAACAGATLSTEDVEAMQTDTSVPEILANVSADDGTDDDAEADDADPAADASDLAAQGETDGVVPPADTTQEGNPTTGAAGAPTPPTTTAGSSVSPEPATSETSSPAAVTSSTIGGATTPSAAPDADGFLPPGTALPSDAECEARVQAAGEVRAANVGPNSKRGGPALSGPEFERVTGNMSGTTDEILQWAACKWGLPADVARAQAATETWWRQGFLGDWTSTAADCAPGHSLGSDGRPGECPQSIGLLQIKYKFFQESFPGAADSTAYSVDYAYAVWRNCYEGRQGWLNDSERGRQYAAGDGWGCIGRWFAGQWYTQPATDYIGHVRDALDSKVWASADFIAEG